MTTADLNYPKTPNEIKYLDHGFIRLVDHMGSDEAIVEAAKLSYSSNKVKTSQDRADSVRLLRYLLRHRHTSPFEMAEVKFHLKLPIFVMRQLVRHRTASINELSARYSSLPEEFYIPAEDYMAPQSNNNKQGRSGELSIETKQEMLGCIEEIYNDSFDAYRRLLGGQFSQDGSDLSRELARIVLPVGIYTECFWKIDLNNLFKFLSLRMDPHAQREIVDLANGIYELTKELFPESICAYDDYIRNSVTFSALEISILRDVFSNIDVDVWKMFAEGEERSFTFSEYFTKREFDEFLEKLKRFKEV